MMNTPRWGTSATAVIGRLARRHKGSERTKARTGGPSCRARYVRAGLLFVQRAARQQSARARPDLNSSDSCALPGDVRSSICADSGRVLAQILGLPSVDERNRAEFQESAWSFIQRPDGPTRLSEAILKTGLTSENDHVIVEGIRQRRTLEALQGAGASARVGKLFVYTPPDLAFEFYKARAGADGVTFDEFIARRESPVERETDELITEADAVLYNWIGRDGHQAAVIELMAELGIRT